MKDRSLRFCVDYRKVNAVTFRDAYLLSRMDEHSDSLGDAALFSIFDANRGYPKIEVEETDREKTAFVFHHGPYPFTSMQSAMRNALGTFERAVYVISFTIKRQHALVY